MHHGTRHRSCLTKLHWCLLSNWQVGMTGRCLPGAPADVCCDGCCCSGGHWEKASECFQQMLSQGCAPDAITYSALITALERGGQWRRALQAFTQMTSHGCHPDSVVYNTLLEVCWRSGVLPAQMRAAQLWTLANRSGHFRWVVMLCCLL